MFERELGYIKNKELRDFTEFVLSKINPTLWDKPSSSSGKYHPAQSNGPKGLLRHVEATVYFSLEWSRVWMLDELETDIATSACILHDGMKYGNGGMSKFCTKEHPQDMARFVELLAKTSSLNQDLVDKLTTAIRNHMGQWASHATMRFPEDFDKISQVVHMADMAASRREVSLGFLETNLIG